MNLRKNVIKLIKELDFTQTFIIDVCNTVNISYNQFFSECVQLSDKLNGYTQNNIIVIMENSIELIKLYFAVMFTKKHIYTIDPQRSKMEMDSIVYEIKDGILITDREDDYIFGQEVVHVKDLFLPVSLEIDAKDYLIECLGNKNFESLFLITYTSGTTGISKGVMHSVGNLFGSALALDEKVEIQRGDVFLHVMPMSYMAGILNSIIYPFLSGLKIAFAGRFSVGLAIRFWDIVDKVKAHVFWLSPAMIMMINRLDHKQIGTEYCHSNNMIFLVGTAPLDDSVRKDFECRYDVKLWASYGLSETLFVSVETPYSKSITCDSNSGELLSNVTYKFKSDNELLINVPWLYLGYINMKSDDFFDREYYITGDLAKIEEQIIYITGRKKDLIIRGGMKISPINIEKIIRRDKNVTELMIFGVRDKNGEEKICCAYVANMSDDLSSQCEENWNKKINEMLGISYKINKFIKLNELPRNINGKVDRAKLEEAILQC